MRQIVAGSLENSGFRKYDAVRAGGPGSAALFGIHLFRPAGRTGADHMAVKNAIPAPVLQARAKMAELPDQRMRLALASPS